MLAWTTQLVSVHSASLWVVLHFNLTIFYLTRIMFFHFEGKIERYLPYKYFSFQPTIEFVVYLILINSDTWHVLARYVLYH